MRHIQTLLPRTEIGVLRWVVVTLSGAFLFVGTWVAYFNGFDPFATVFLLTMLALSIFLWRMHRMARSFAKFVLGALMVILIGGTFNPFFMLDYQAAHNGESPNWWMLAAILSPIILGALFCYGVLDKYQAQFLQKVKNDRQA